MKGTVMAAFILCMALAFNAQAEHLSHSKDKAIIQLLSSFKDQRGKLLFANLADCHSQRDEFNKHLSTLSNIEYELKTSCMRIKTVKNTKSEGHPFVINLHHDGKDLTNDNLTFEGLKKLLTTLYRSATSQPLPYTHTIHIIETCSEEPNQNQDIKDALHVLSNYFNTVKVVTSIGGPGVCSSDITYEIDINNEKDIESFKSERILQLIREKSINKIEENNETAYLKLMDSVTKGYQKRVKNLEIGALINKKLYTPKAEIVFFRTRPGTDYPTDLKNSSLKEFYFQQYPSDYPDLNSTMKENLVSFILLDKQVDNGVSWYKIAPLTPIYGLVDYSIAGWISPKYTVGNKTSTFSSLSDITTSKRVEILFPVGAQTSVKINDLYGKYKVQAFCYGQNKKISLGDENNTIISTEIEFRPPLQVTASMLTETDGKTCKTVVTTSYEILTGSIVTNNGNGSVKQGCYNNSLNTAFLQESLMDFTSVEKTSYGFMKRSYYVDSCEEVGSPNGMAIIKYTRN